MTRCCCYCSNCGPVSSKDAEQTYDSTRYKAWADRIVTRRRIYLVFASFFIILGVVSDHAQFFGNKYMKRGVQKGTASLSSMSSYFQIIEDDSNGIVTASNGIDTAFESTTCTYVQTHISSYTSIINQVQSYATSVGDLVKNFPDKLNRIRHLLQYYGVYIQFIVVISIYAVVVFTFALFILGLITRNALVCKFGIGSASSIVFFLTIICSVVMVVVVSIYSTHSIFHSSILSDIVVESCC